MGEKLEDVFQSARATFVCAGQPTLTTQQLNAEFNATEGKDIPYREHGFPNIERFLISAGMQVNGGRVSYRSEKASHITTMIKNQKTAPKQARLPVRPSGNYASMARRSVSTPVVSMNSQSNLSLARNSPSLRPDPRREPRSAPEIPAKREVIEIQDGFKEALKIAINSYSKPVAELLFIFDFDANKQCPYKLNRQLSENGEASKDFFLRHTKIFEISYQGSVLFLSPAKNAWMAPPKLIAVPAAAPPPSVVTAPVLTKLVPTAHIVARPPPVAPVVMRPLEIAPVVMRPSEIAPTVKRTSEIAPAVMRPSEIAPVISSPTVTSTSEPEVFNTEAEALNVPTLDAEGKFLYLPRAPHSTAFSLRAVDKKAGKIKICEFTPQKGLETCAILAEDAGELEALSRSEADKRIEVEDYYRGMPCWAALSKSKLVRAVFLSSDGEEEIIVYLVDYGIKQSLPMKSLHEMDDEGRSKDCLAFTAIIVNILPPEGKSVFKTIIRQAIRDGLKGRECNAQILGYEVGSQRYNVALAEVDVLANLVAEGSIRFDTPKESPEVSNKVLIAKVEVLRNGCSYIILRKEDKFYVPSGCLSELLNLEEDNFVSELEKIGISIGQRLKVDQDILELLMEHECPFVEEKQSLIPLEAALPLVMGFVALPQHKHGRIHEKVFRQLMDLTQAHLGY